MAATRPRYKLTAGELPLLKEAKFTDTALKCAKRGDETTASGFGGDRDSRRLRL